jgi:hypothetical protein
MTYGHRLILSRYIKHGSNKMHKNVFTSGIGLNPVGHIKESSERHNKTGKDKPPTKAISSEGHC